MPIFQDNRSLLERFRAGDRAALTEVFERYADEVALLARRGFTLSQRGLFIPGASSADQEAELVQETFVRAFSKDARARFDGIRPYRPYLLRIARNLMIDRMRARALGRAEGQQGVGDLESLPMEPLESSPELDLHEKRLQEATSSYLATLDSLAQRFVQLRFSEDLSQDDVAAQLGCSRRKVRTLEGRVQKGLRKHLQSLGLLLDS